MPNHCANGHELADGFAFCPICGSARAADGTVTGEDGATDGGASRSHIEDEQGAAPAPVEEGSRVLPPAAPFQASPATNASGAPSSGPNRTRLVVLVSAAVLVVAAAVGLAIALGGSKHTITGEMTLMDSDGYDSGLVGGCQGTGGYDDIGAGTAVTVRDGAGEILATSSLDSGEEIGDWCTFDFTVEDVPGADFYEVEVSHRGGLSYSDEEMEEKDWSVQVSLGDPF